MKTVFAILDKPKIRDANFATLSLEILMKQGITTATFQNTISASLTFNKNSILFKDCKTKQKAKNYFLFSAAQSARTCIATQNSVKPVNQHSALTVYLKSLT